MNNLVLKVEPRNTDGDTEPRTLHDDNDEDDDNNEDDDNDEDDDNASNEGNMSEVIVRGVDGPNGKDEHIDDLEFDLNIGYDEYQQEILDRHWEVMAKTFRSEGEAYMFYKPISLFEGRKTTCQILYHGRPDPQTETGESMLL
ncbi:putative LRR receptor-like serine/threonine-protein kinase [Hordeum vulgare]|nr:putative LRR receptor-like serine/threonine-protein kinase [Hordeum vulgare]